MSEPARRRATYQDVLDAPEHCVAQLIDGELYVMPRPKRRHLRTASLLGGYLLGRFDAAVRDGGGWVVVDEPELHLGADVLVPDLGAWRVERYPGRDDDSDEAFYTVHPDWVAEVLSESTARIDRMKKMPIYAREGVPYVWLVDPRDRTVEVFRLEAESGAGPMPRRRYVLLGTWGGDEQDFVLEPFDAAPIPPASFWGRLPPREPAP